MAHFLPVTKDSINICGVITPLNDRQTIFYILSNHVLKTDFSEFWKRMFKILLNFHFIPYFSYDGIDKSTLYKHIYCIICGKSFLSFCLFVYNLDWWHGAFSARQSREVLEGSKAKLKS